jgi:hypothetical protein
MGQLLTRESRPCHRSLQYNSKVQVSKCSVQHTRTSRDIPPFEVTAKVQYSRYCVQDSAEEIAPTQSFSCTVLYSRCTGTGNLCKPLSSSRLFLPGSMEIWKRQEGPGVQLESCLGDSVQVNNVRTARSVRATAAAIASACLRLLLLAACRAQARAYAHAHSDAYRDIPSLTLPYLPTLPTPDLCPYSTPLAFWLFLSLRRYTANCISRMGLRCWWACRKLPASRTMHEPCNRFVLSSWPPQKNSGSSTSLAGKTRESVSHSCHTPPTVTTPVVTIVRSVSPIRLQGSKQRQPCIWEGGQWPVAGFAQEGIWTSEPSTVLYYYSVALPATPMTLEA